MRREQPGLARLPHLGRIKTDGDVGLRALSFEQQPRQQIAGLVIDRAAALGLEGLLDRGAGAPFGAEVVGGIDGEGLVLRERRGGGECEGKTRDQAMVHGHPPMRAKSKEDACPETFPPPV